MKETDFNEAQEYKEENIEDVYKRQIMMRRLNKRNLWLLLLPFLLAACQSYKKVPYFQNVEVVNEVEQQEKLYDAKIMPKDLLTIVVSCTNPELAIPFNLTVASNASLTTSCLLYTSEYRNW